MKRLAGIRALTAVRQVWVRANWAIVLSGVGRAVSAVGRARRAAKLREGGQLAPSSTAAGVLGGAVGPARPARAGPTGRMHTTPRGCSEVQGVAGSARTSKRNSLAAAAAGPQPRQHRDDLGRDLAADPCRGSLFAGGRGKAASARKIAGGQQRRGLRGPTARSARHFRLELRLPPPVSITSPVLE